ncbi:MAG: site-specific integrase [Candidatus Thiodiazotropha sp. (ex Codakia rugifera)]|nr:site-specific integrase [Candidatus Thiodiazotropha sp. (ex Codakia rugifera)]
MEKITKTMVDRADPEEVRYFIWDVEIKGFGLLVLPSGVKSFLYQYRNSAGRTRRTTIGKYSATMTADLARKQAKKLRRAVEDGRDPLEEKKANKEALTVTELLEKYLESARFAEKADSTQSIDRGRINRHLIPTLGKKIAKKLTTEHVRRAFASIRDGKTACDVKTKSRGRARVKGGEGTARMAIRVLCSILNWAIDEGYLSSNPATGVKIGSDGIRETILESTEQYKSLFQTLDTMEIERRLRSAVADAIRVIALTGARRNEIASLRWSHVDLKAGVITLPPNAHKTGRSTGKSRVIGLPAAAQAIIANQKGSEPDDFVFPPARGNGPINLSKPWRTIRVEANLPEGIGLHGLRHSLASHMAMQGAQAAEIMTALGHHQLSTAQRYVHWAQDERSQLAEKAASHISAALDDKKKANVEVL